LAVQIASQRGALVVATASRRHHEFLRGLGAHTLIDYTDQDVAEAVRAQFSAGVDKALNGVTGEGAKQAARSLRPGGRMVDLPGTLAEAPPGVEVISDYVVRGDGARLARIARMVDDGALKLTVEDVLPFEQAPQALERVLTKRVRGKLALRVQG
jgi:NADPH:quinone reductase-like Zn-dependent oxidoreductase